MSKDNVAKAQEQFEQMLEQLRAGGSNTDPIDNEVIRAIYVQGYLNGVTDGLKWSQDTLTEMAK
jgi:hypothetical protein